MSVLWYDKQGHPIPGTKADSGSDEWQQGMLKVESMLGDKAYKIVKQDYTPKKKYWISTVWLGLDHSFTYSLEDPNPHPIIFETMVFSGKAEMDTELGFKVREDYYQERYSTEGQALRGHARALKKYTKKESQA